MRSTETGDALGEALLDAVDGGKGVHFLERDDGYIKAMDASLYFSKPFSWPDAEASALRNLTGRVLDIGAGAGRHSVALQNRGCEPTALDISPGAVEVCRQRGIKRTFQGSVFDLLEAPVDSFDSLILMGNNLSLLQSDARAAGMFDAMRELLNPGGSVIGTCLDPYITDNPDHLSYHEANRAAGRFPGQIRMRFRYRRLASDWFNILFMSPAELRALAERSGWAVVGTTNPDPDYVAVLRPM